MGILNRIKEAVNRLLDKDGAERLGAKETSAMRDAVREWDDVFFRSKMPKCAVAMAVLVTDYLATLSASEIALSAGSSPRGEWIERETAATMVPVLHDAVQMAAQGGMAAVKPYVRGGHVYVEVIPRSRIAVRRWGPLGRAESGFFTDFDRLPDGSPVCRVEDFDLGTDTLRITNTVYRLRTGRMLGGELPLESVERWAALAPKVEIQNVDRPHFGLLRMPGANNIDASPAPVSFYAQALESIRQIDETMAQLYWERDTGKRRMMIDRTMAAADPLTGKVPLSFRQLSPDFTISMDMPDKAPWSDYTPSIRIEEYRKTLETQFRVLEMQTGLSQGTFSIEPRSGRVTATQVISDDRTTYNTVLAVQTRGLASGLRDALYWFDAYASLYSIAPAGEFEPSVSFGDSIFEDTGTEFARRLSLANAGYLRPELLNAWYFGVDEDSARAMLPDDSPGAPLTF